MSFQATDCTGIDKSNLQQIRKIHKKMKKKTNSNISKLNPHIQQNHFMACIHVLLVCTVIVCCCPHAIAYRAAGVFSLW